MKTTDDWVARHVPDTQEAIRQALEVLDRYGYSAADLDVLLFEGQSTEHDPDLEAAIGLLARLREAGVKIA
jgi:EAL domain-containing protein (putative c-di-GMP-specific phosphodiesterase class I)